MTADTHFDTLIIGAGAAGMQAAAFAGAVGLHLRWSHYLATMRTLLKQLDRGKPEKEKVLLTALCAVLDAFHYNLSGARAAEAKSAIKLILFIFISFC